MEFGGPGKVRFGDGLRRAGRQRGSGESPPVGTSRWNRTLARQSLAGSRVLVVRPELAIGDDELGPVRVEHVVELFLKLGQVLLVEVDSGVSFVARVPLGAVDGQQRCPRQAALPHAGSRAAQSELRFCGLDLVVEIRVGAEQQLPADVPNQKQLLQRGGDAVARAVRQPQARVILGFCSVRPGRGVDVDPIEDRVGDRLGHAGQVHQGVSRGALLLLFPLGQDEQVQPGRLVFRPKPDTRDLVLVDPRGDDAEPGAMPALLVVAHQDAAKQVRVVETSPRLLSFVP